MKPEKKNSQGLYLQKRNNRWKWMAGATAATAAGAAASQASTITIHLLNNYISGPGGNHLNADLTADGHPDLTIAGAYAYRIAYQDHGYTLFLSRVGVNLNGVNAGARWYQDDVQHFVVLGSQGKAGYFGAISLTGSIPIFFKDLHINGGAPTEGFLKVTVSSPGVTIQLDSFTYNDPSFAVPDRGSSLASVPDQGSSLAFLAMGAGGILALRRWRTARGRS